MLREKILRTIILYSFIGLMFSCSVVPITGRKEFNIVGDEQILSLSQQQYNQFIGSSKVNNISPSNRKALYIAKKLAIVTDDYLRKNDYTDLANTLHWEFNIVVSPQVNAFCMPGGKIVVYTGLINLIGNAPHGDAMLAAVIGHEIGHALARHANERMSNNVLIGLGEAALGMATSKQSEITRNIIGFSYNIGSKLFVALPFSRRQEYEADKIGLVLMAMAGYNPKYAVDLWYRMAKNSGSNNPMELISTHPSDENRIREIENYLPEAMKYYNPNMKYHSTTGNGFHY